MVSGLRFSILLLGMLALASLGIAQINTTNPFNCQNEYIIYNATSQLYTGVYDGCSRLPVLLVINQSNVTVVNRSDIIVANYSINLTTVQCNETSLLQTFSNRTDSLIGSLEERFNLTGLYADCRISKDTLQKEVSACANKVGDYEQNYVNRSVLQVQADSCSAQINATGTKLLGVEGLLGYYALGGAVIASLLIWFFRLRGRSDYKDSSMPIQGEESIHTKAIEADARKAQESYNRENLGSYRKRVTEGVELFKKKKKRGS